MTPDPKQLPHLIDLLDEESPQIRQTVARQILMYGPNLKSELLRLPWKLIDRHERILTQIIDFQQRLVLEQNWPRLVALKNNMGGMEKAMTLLSEFLNGIRLRYQQNISQLLDRMAEEFLSQSSGKDPLKLANFLFRTKGIKGNTEDYYNPQNSNLTYVILERKGIPVSLTAVYMLVGARLGIHVVGNNFSGHFMARVEYEGRELLIDCFNEGRAIESKDVVHLNLSSGRLSESRNHKSCTETTLHRILSELIHAYRSRGENDNQQLMIKLYNALDDTKQISGSVSFDEESLKKLRQEPLYKPGALVRHRRYGYRGIIVDFTMQCRADDQWYFNNQTQPDRQQPWYHVLVHESEQVTYAAESNLIKDCSNRNVDHPLVDYFFSRSAKGDYLRNNIPWPGE